MFTVGEEAKKLFTEANNMLNNIVNDSSFTCRAVIGFYRAQSVVDDIQLLDVNSVHIDTLFGLRQQVI